jgi:hypothetical protein
LLSYGRLSKKPLLFKSFTGLSVQAFDNIYDKEITKRYKRYEIHIYPKNIEKEKQVQQGGLSNWMLKTDF